MREDMGFDQLSPTALPGRRSNRGRRLVLTIHEGGQASGVRETSKLRAIVYRPELPGHMSASSHGPERVHSRQRKLVASAPPVSASAGTTGNGTALRAPCYSIDLVRCS